MKTDVTGVAQPGTGQRRVDKGIAMWRLMLGLSELLGLVVLSYLLASALVAIRGQSSDQVLLPMTIILGVEVVLPGLFALVRLPEERAAIRVAFGHWTVRWVVLITLAIDMIGLGLLRAAPGDLGQECRRRWWWRWRSRWGWR